MSSQGGAATAPPAAQLDVLQVLLDVPQRVGTGLQLSHLVICQGHVDHAGHASAVQHAGQTQIHLVTDSIHALNTASNNLTVGVRIYIPKTEKSVSREKTKRNSYARVQKGRTPKITFCESQFESKCKDLKVIITNSSYRCLIGQHLQA